MAETSDVPAGKVRDGDSVPYRKASRDEIERRILLAKRMISRRAFACEITTLLRARYGISRAQCWVYIKRARAMIAEEAGVTPEQARQDAINFYVETIRTSDDDKVRLIAQRRLDEIFGVAAAPKLPLGPDGRPAAPHTVNIHLVRAALASEQGRRMLAEMAEQAGGLQGELPGAIRDRLNGEPPPA